MTDDDHADDDADAGPEPAPGPRSPARKASIRTPLDPVVATGLGRCLRARLDQLDRDIIHVTDLALKEPFYSHAAANLLKIRTDAAKHLTEFEGAVLAPP